MLSSYLGAGSRGLTLRGRLLIFRVSILKRRRTVCGVRCAFIGHRYMCPPVMALVILQVVLERMQRARRFPVSWRTSSPAHIFASFCLKVLGKHLSYILAAIRLKLIWLHMPSIAPIDRHFLRSSPLLNASNSTTSTVKAKYLSF